MTSRDLIFLALGAGIAAVITYVATKSRTEKECFEEYNQLLDEYRKELIGEEPKEEEKSAKTEPAEAPDLSKKINVELDTDFAALAADHAEERSNARRILMEQKYGTALEEKTVGEAKEPYVIPEEMWGYKGFTTCSIQWWPQSNVATYEVGGSEVVDLPFRIGMANLKDFEAEYGEGGYGYVRNEEEHVDYQVEVCWGECPYITSANAERILFDDD